jgi:gliding motility-associated-like protein
MKIAITLICFFCALNFSSAQSGSFIVPSFFSPDGDGVNDSLMVSGKEIQGYELKIYSRWGEEVAKLDGKAVKSWNGKFKGKEVTDGVYVWLATVSFINGENKNLNGYVTLLRGDNSKN